MSLSDCIKCWNTPCCCGWDWIDWKDSGIKNQIELLTKLLEYKKKYPQATKQEIWRYIK